MSSRLVIGLAAAAALALTLPFAGHAQNAQQRPQGAAPAAPAAPPKPMKEAIVGSWSLLIADDVAADGTHTPQFGPNAMGLATFGSDGRYSIQIMRAVLPKFAGNARTKGTADENKAVVQGMIAHFGTYTVDEPSKTLTFRIEGSSFPNWAGTTQKRQITSLTAGDEITWKNPTPSTGAPGAELAWKWNK